LTVRPLSASILSRALRRPSLIVGISPTLKT